MMGMIRSGVLLLGLSATNWNLNKEFKKISDLKADDYEGQIAIVGGAIIITGGLLAFLIELGLVLIIAGLIYVAVYEIAEEMKRNSRYYYKAYMQFNIVYVASLPITLSQASNRVVQGYNVYTYTSSLAYAATTGSGLGAVYHSNHAPGFNPFGIYYFDHYHPANFNGAHVWFGLPKK